MKRIFIFLAAAFMSAWFSYAGPPIGAFAPVGPPPSSTPIVAPSGQLQVYSALTGRREGDNPTWKQHTDYYVYNGRGRRLERVRNTVGNYAQRPRVITLPAGSYVVKARARNYSWVNVPVVVRDGLTTRVYLDDSWRPPTYARNTQIIRAPDGQLIGWCVN